MTGKPEQHEDDDGRVICNMDVAGMPWHDRRARSAENAARAARIVPQGEQLTRSEAWRYTWNAVLAGLLIVGVFSAVWVLFILFCIHVWFR